MRGGTSNAALAAGMAAAFCEANKELKENYALVMKLRDYFVSKIESEIPFVRYNGDRVKRLPQNANFSFEGLKAGELIPALDLAGVACASGSACSSGSVEPSHVLLALGAGEELAASAVRFSLGKSTTRGEIDYAVGQIKKTVEKFRKPLPLFKEIKSKTEKV